MISLDKIAYTSKIRMQNPNEKLAFSVSFLFLVLYCDHLVISSLVFLIMAYATLGKSKLEIKRYIGLLALPFLFSFMGVLGILFTQWQGELTRVELYSMINLFMRAISSTSCLYFLILSTPMTDVFYSLQCLACPKLLVELMLLIYRYIFVLLEFANTIYISQDSRLGYSTYKNSISSLGKLISALFLSSYQKSMEYYSAMEARNYDGELNVLSLSYFSDKKNYYKILLSCAVLLFIYYKIR